MLASLKTIVDDLNVIARQSKDSQTEENTNQYVDFLFESSKKLRPDSISIKQFLKTSLEEFIKIPRSEIPSLSMRSKFRIEDILKCV